MAARCDALHHRPDLVCSLARPPLPLGAGQVARTLARAGQRCARCTCRVRCAALQPQSVGLTSDCTIQPRCNFFNQTRPTQQPCSKELERRRHWCAHCAYSEPGSPATSSGGSSSSSCSTLSASACRCSASRAASARGWRWSRIRGSSRPVYKTMSGGPLLSTLSCSTVGDRKAGVKVNIPNLFCFPSFRTPSNKAIDR